MGDDREWSVRDVLSVVEDGRSVALTPDDVRRRRIQQSAQIVREHLRNDGTVYGVNTGFGDSQSRRIPEDRLDELPANLVRYHGCGSGDALPPDVSHSALLIRLITLARSYSGVRLDLLETMCDYVNHPLIPVIPREGSVGASGDLTPLSYVAAVLQGDRDLWQEGEARPADEVLEQTDVDPLTLAPKEALALMNGTSVMTALMTHAVVRAGYLAGLIARATAMTSVALRGNPRHFHARLFELKPHPGQARAADWIRRCLPDPDGTDAPPCEDGSQDRYSLRCAPHIIGVLSDALRWIYPQLETEINGVDDNPIVDPEEETIHHGGNFYGGHVGFAADSLKNAVANLSDLADRELASLVDPKFNRGLPADLVGVEAPDRPLHHGFKALQIATSSWAAEALKLTVPSGVFSRSTESHNQDKVSMGTHGARDAIRILELTEQATAALLMGATQGLDLRERAQELDPAALPDPLRETHAQVRERVDFVTRDRRLDGDLETLTGAIRARAIPVDLDPRSPA